MTHPQIPSRRIVFQGALGCAVLALSGCGTSQTPQDSGKTPASKSVTLGSASEVPVGGGVIYPDAKVIVTQPTKGTFLAFSALCTHQGFAINKIADGVMTCPLHGSQFSVADGAAVKGPATSALGKVDLKVDGDSLIVTL